MIKNAELKQCFDAWAYFCKLLDQDMNEKSNGVIKVATPEQLKRTWEFRLRDLAHVASNVLFNIKGNDPAGMLAYHIVRERDEATFDEYTYAYISEFVVKYEYRGMGFGTELLNALFSLPEVHASKHVTVGTIGTANRRAMDLYERNGFRIVGVTYERENNGHREPK